MNTYQSHRTEVHQHLREIERLTGIGAVKAANSVTVKAIRALVGMLETQPSGCGNCPCKPAVPAIPLASLQAGAQAAPLPAATPNPARASVTHAAAPAAPPVVLTPMEISPVEIIPGEIVAAETVLLETVPAEKAAVETTPHEGPGAVALSSADATPDSKVSEPSEDKSRKAKKPLN